MPDNFLPEKEKKQSDHTDELQAVATQRFTATASYYGPIPPASEMAKYEDIQPGMADRIMAMAEKQSEHRQNIEKIVITNDARKSLLGVVFAFIICMSCLIIAGLCFYWDKNGLGVFISSFGLTSVVGTFIYGTRSNRKEREQKTKMMLDHQKNEAP